MASNILEAITAKYPSLTRSGKKLADYIFSHTSDTQYLSISALAENSGVSEASITRFCHGLGLSGYNDFKLELAKTSVVTDMGEPVGTLESFTSTDSLDEIFHKIHASCISSLNDTLDLLKQKEISRAVNYLVNAKRVFCFGHGGSSVMAREAWARFSTVSSNFIHIEDSHMQVMAAALATSKDAILFFSYSGATKDMEDILQIAYDQKIPVILITHFPRARAAEFARVVLLCGYNESPLQSGSIPAKLGQMFLIDCLFFAYCKKIPEQSAVSRMATAEAVSKKLL